MNSLQTFAPVLSPCQEENNACAAYRSCTVVYICDSLGVGGLRNLKESFLRAATRKNEKKLRKTEKTWKKKITPMKVTSVKMRYQI